MTSAPGSSQKPARKTSRLQARLIACFAIFLIAFGVRVLTWHDTRLEVGKIQTVVVADYQRIAELFRAGRSRSFFSSSSALADLNTLGHPPGYPILIAVIYSVFGRSITTLQFFQIAADALAAVVLFLIVAELLPLSAAVVAGLLAAFSPQFAWNSVLLLPDSVSVLPILLAIYLLTRATKNPRLLTFILIGALIGVSCWLRANAMLLTLFIAGTALLMFSRKRWQFALAVICGTLLIVLPLTIRNAIVFHRFIPLSLGAGQTFLEGIADYDKEASFGVPDTDMGIMKQEAEIYRRPDYYGTLFNPDGVERERARLSRGFAIVRSHPFWFAGVMAKRASSMVRLERARLLSTEPATTHSVNQLTKPVSVKADGDLVSQAILFSTRAKLQTLRDGGQIAFTGDDSNYGVQAAWQVIVSASDPMLRVHELPSHADLDYVVKIPIEMERGRIRVSVVNDYGVVLSTAVAETVEGLQPENQPLDSIELPFVADDSGIRVVISNEASANPIAQVGPIEVYELGPARFLWTRYPRFIIHAIQKIFLTAVMLPLAIIGLLILILRRNILALLTLSLVPIYFFTVQSAVHTEYRYVIAVTYFSFAFAGVAIGFGLDIVVKKLTTLVKSSSAMKSVPSA